MLNAGCRLDPADQVQAESAGKSIRRCERLRGSLSCRRRPTEPYQDAAAAYSRRSASTVKIALKARAKT